MSKFYIPPCTNDVCEERLNSLSKQLSKEGYLIIEAVYSGSRAKLFKEGVEEASFTILHKCPTLWNFIKTAGLDAFLKEKQDLYDKLMCVQFDGISLGKLSDNPSSLARYETFFEDLNIQDISNDAKLQRLVQNIQACKRKSSKNVPTSSEASLYISPGFNYAKVQFLYENVTSQENDFRKKLMELRDEYANRLIEEDGELVWYPSQNATVKVFAKIMNGKQESTKLLNVSKLTTLEEVKEHINQVLGNSETATCNLQFLLNKNFTEAPVWNFVTNLKNASNDFPRNVIVEEKRMTSSLTTLTLPELYNHEMLYGLVVMAVCDEPNLQKQSLTRVELLVLKGKLRALDTSFEMLVVLKHVLIDSIEQMRRNKTQDDVLHELIKRKCFLLYNIQIELIFKMQKPENRDLRNLSIRSEESRPAVDTYISSTQSFLGLTTEEVTQFLKEFLSVSLKTENDGNTLIGLKDYKQFYILMKQMKMLFKFNSRVNEDLLSLEYLKAYLRAKPKPKRRPHPQLCLYLIQQGILHYLRFLSEESINPDTTAQFLSALEIVKMLKTPSNIKQMASSLKHIMFCPDDDLRRQVIHFVQADEDFYEPWQRHVIRFIEEMFPTLKINPEDKVSSWQTLSCTFMDSQVNLTVHNDMEISPKASSMTNLGKSQGQIKISDVEMLRSLQHENILDLYAFNLGSVPEFFITEQLCEKHDKNLQHFLVNKSLTKKLCLHSTLLKYLFQAAAAIEYCHMNDIILRDITAKSFIVAANNSVKLFKLKLARKLEAQSELIDKDSFLKIPTRWSAPESLWRFKWSKFSDVWMYGHLCYEVLTHGALPYSNLCITDQEFMWKLRCGTCNINQEDCISDEEYQVIQKCAQYCDKNRPNMSKMKHFLMLLERNTQSMRGSYPSLKSANYKPSKHFSKGYPQVQDSKSTCSKDSNYDTVYSKHQKFRMFRMLSSGLKQYWKIGEKENKHSFQEKVKRQFSPHLLQQIMDGALDGILPGIYIKKKTDGQYIIKVKTFQQLEGNVLEMVLNKTLARSADDFKILLLKISQLLDNFHKLNFVIGNLRASQLFVLKLTGSDYKIYPVSLAYLQNSQDSRNQIFKQEMCDPIAEARSAPEVSQSNSYSTASDVYCFGLVIRDLFMARINSGQMKPVTSEVDLVNFDELESNINLTTFEKPAGMEPKLYKIIEMCTNRDIQRRPSIEDIIRLIEPHNDALSTKVKAFKKMSMKSIRSGSTTTVRSRQTESQLHVNNASETSETSYSTISHISTKCFEVDLMEVNYQYSKIEDIIEENKSDYAELIEHSKDTETEEHKNIDVEVRTSEECSFHTDLEDTLLKLPYEQQIREIKSTVKLETSVVEQCVPQSNTNSSRDLLVQELKRNLALKQQNTKKTVDDSENSEYDDAFSMTDAESFPTKGIVSNTDEKNALHQHTTETRTLLNESVSVTKSIHRSFNSENFPYDTANPEPSTNSKVEISRVDRPQNFTSSSEKSKSEFVSSSLDKPQVELVSSSLAKPQVELVSSSLAKPQVELVSSSLAKPQVELVSSSLDKPQVELVSSSLAKPQVEFVSSSLAKPQEVDVYSSQEHIIQLWLTKKNEMQGKSRSCFGFW